MHARIKLKKRFDCIHYCPLLTFHCAFACDCTTSRKPTFEFSGKTAYRSHTQRSLQDVPMPFPALDAREIGKSGAIKAVIFIKRLNNGIVIII